MNRELAEAPDRARAMCDACTVGHGCVTPDSPHDGCKREAVMCIRRKKVKEKAKMEREQFKQQVHNTICGANREASREATIEIDVVKKPDHYRHGTFEVIDEMLIVFGVEQTLVFCRLNAWKYRARAPYKGTFEQDMDKANRYLEMAYEISQIRQEYPEADGYEVVFLLKGRRTE